jgi:hypothetical protein
MSTDQMTVGFHVVALAPIGLVLSKSGWVSCGELTSLKLGESLEGQAKTRVTAIPSHAHQCPSGGGEGHHVMPRASQYMGKIFHHWVQSQAESSRGEAIARCRF